MFDSWVRKISVEKKMTTHSNMLSWEMPWTEEPGGYSPLGRKELDRTD